MMSIRGSRSVHCVSILRNVNSSSAFFARFDPCSLCPSASTCLSTNLSCTAFTVFIYSMSSITVNDSAAHACNYQREFIIRRVRASFLYESTLIYKPAAPRVSQDPLVQPRATLSRFCPSNFCLIPSTFLSLENPNGRLVGFVFFSFSIVPNCASFNVHF